MPAMRAQASSVYIAVITISASSGPILVRTVHSVLWMFKFIWKFYKHSVENIFTIYTQIDIKIPSTIVLLRIYVQWHY